MYVGHFAAGLALKGSVPEAPTWGLLIGVGLPDLLFGPFVWLGIERVSLTPGVPPGFYLNYIDWSHSLAMSVAWSLLYGLLFLRRGLRIAGIMALAVFSHFLLDLPMHPPDLALWPGASLHLGFGLWPALPTGWWFVELLVVAAGLAWYRHCAPIDGRFGGRPWAVALLLLLLHAGNSPWLSMI